LGKSPYKVNKPLACDDVEFDFDLTVKLNNQSVVPSTRLPTLLSAMSDDIAQIELSNKDVSATFEIVIQVARGDHIDGVEHAFGRMVADHFLTVGRIHRFIKDCSQFKSAIQYCDGICQYLYGVIAKERSSDSHLTFDEHHERLNAAFDALNEFDRKLSRLICALVAFNFNQFDIAVSLSKGRLNLISTAFNNALNGKSWPFDSPAITNYDSAYDSAYDNLLTDYVTHKILKFAENKPVELLKHDLPIVQTKSRNQLTEHDHKKITILVGEGLYATGNMAGAREKAKELIHDATAENWAMSMLARIDEGRKP
jgi:hypothetical protein